MTETVYTLIAQRTVNMPPFGKERPRVTRNSTHMPEAYTKKKMWLKAEFGYFDSPDLVRLTVVAVRPLPKSWSKKKRKAMRGRYAKPRPDLDNILGGVMDALFPDDDDLVVETAVRKIWGDEPAIHIRIEGIDYQ